MSAVWPKVSVKASAEDFSQQFQNAAVKSGAVLIEGLEFEAPWKDIKRLHDLLASRPDLRERLNSAQPKDKPNYKTAAVNPEANKNPGALIDQKVSLDLSAKRLADLHKSGVDVVELLGESFQSIIHFYNSIEQGLIPRTLDALSGLVDDNLAYIHKDRAITLRLSNYFPRRANASPAPRCGEHKDFGTFTVLFQDPLQAGLELFIDGAWQPVPPGCCLITFGWCAQIRSNDRIQAVLHRVTDGVADSDGTIPRRDATIFFVAPDVGARLEPVVRDGEVPHYASVLTHGEFKVKMARKWQEREGTVEPGQETKTQEEIVEELRALVKHPAVLTPATEVAPGAAVVHAVCA
ncbi:probable feruloyl CoA ortho-hydroxylase 2 at C-terminar half [Coccomyxa sp. Obi]|nr:probable feruloyl CoA ortho-hydroxylase 2 at C-terminar half [Coccomyxa sp. Obi]